MDNIKLTIQYDGTGFHGWQIQPTLRTVEETVKKAVEETVGHEITLYGSGRTDKGVHAMGQVANFKTETTIDLGNLPRVINYHLPEDVHVVHAKKVHHYFHSRFSAKGKWYRYIIDNHRINNPVYRHQMGHMPFKLDVDRMRAACECLLGEQDFGTFMGNKAEVPHTIRRIDDINIERHGDFIIMDFKGKSFLKHQIRIIVGTAMQIGRGKLDISFMEEALKKTERGTAGPTAPAHGLYLMEVYYDERDEEI